MADHRAPGTATLEGEVRIADFHHPVDTGQVGNFWGGMQQRFFEITTLADGRDNGLAMTHLASTGKGATGGADWSDR